MRAAWVDRQARKGALPSDHAPVIIDLNEALDGDIGPVVPPPSENVYGQAGIRLPRVAVDQFNSTVPVASPQPGDLVFFANTYQPGISHVGIYIGNGLQINAPTTGQVVTVASVLGSPLRWGSQSAHIRNVALGSSLVS